MAPLYSGFDINVKMICYQLIFRNKFQFNINENAKCFVPENALQNIVSEMETIYIQTSMWSDNSWSQQMQMQR